MNNRTYLPVIALSLASFFVSLSASASGDHAHGHHHATVAKQAGPNGGRLIQTVEPNLEFFLTEDRFVQITFLDSDAAAVAPGTQKVTLVGGDRTQATKLSFEVVGAVLRSTAPLPDQANIPIILQIKVSPEAKPVREKFYLNLSECGGCNFKEYACICGH